MRGVEVFLPLDDDSKCKSDSKAARGQIKLDVLAEEAKYGRSLCENQPHIQRRSKLRFSFFFFSFRTKLCVVIYRASLHHELSPFSFSF